MLRRKVDQVVARVVEGLLLPQSGYEVVIYVQPVEIVSDPQLRHINQRKINPSFATLCLGNEELSCDTW